MALPGVRAGTSGASDVERVEAGGTGATVIPRHPSQPPSPRHKRPCAAQCSTVDRAGCSYAYRQLVKGSGAQSSNSRLAHHFDVMAEEVLGVMAEEVLGVWPKVLGHCRVRSHDRSKVLA